MTVRSAPYAMAYTPHPQIKIQTQTTSNGGNSTQSNIISFRNMFVIQSNEIKWPNVNLFVCWHCVSGLSGCSQIVLNVENCAINELSSNVDQ